MIPALSLQILAGTRGYTIQLSHSIQALTTDVISLATIEVLSSALSWEIEQNTGLLHEV